MFYQEIEGIKLQLKKARPFRKDEKLLMPFMEVVRTLFDNPYVVAKFPKPNCLSLELQGVKNESKKQLIVLIKDTTDACRRRKEELEKKMQTIFFASVAHDLRTPLNSLLASNTILIPLMKGNQLASQALKLQRSSINFLMSLVEDILDLSKI